MDEMLLKRAEEVLRKLQVAQEEVVWPLLREGARIEREIEKELEKTRRRVKVRCDWVMLKNFKTGRIDSVPYNHATKMVKNGTGEILREFEPFYESHWVVEREPQILTDLRRVHLGEPVRIGGQMSDFFDAVNHVIGLEALPLITAAAFQVNLKEGKDEEEEEEKTDKEKTDNRGKRTRAGSQAGPDR